MADTSHELVELARRIVEHEVGRSPDPAASAAAVETGARKLNDQLVDLLGSGGVTALFRRALHLAQREQPVLAPVVVSGEPPACFTSLEESLRASTADEATAAAATVLAHVLGLLVMLLGDDLGMKPVRRLWPQATSIREIDV